MKDHGREDEWEPPIGARYLAASGRIWTVRSITSRGRRVVITSDLPDGEQAAASAAISDTPHRVPVGRLGLEPT